MTPPLRRTPRLRHELLLRLMLPLLAIVAASAAIGIYAAQRLTDSVYDRWLLDAAHSLEQQIRFVDRQAVLVLPAAAEAVLTYDEIDRINYSVTQEGRLVSGTAGIPETGERHYDYVRGRAYDTVFEGRRVRVAAVETDDGGGQHAEVLVSETLAKRQRTQKSVMAMLLPLCALLPATAIAIGLGVRRTLQPLEAVANRWEERSHTSLNAIATDDIPRELMPFASALNDLLARIRAMLTRERQFAANVAHQLRTPLAGIRLGLARAIESPDLDSNRAVLRELDRSTQRTTRLVQQLLALGRLDPEVGGRSDFEPTDLAALAHTVGATYLEQAMNKRIDLEFHEPERPIVVVAHPDLLSEALGNLLENALNYTPRGGKVAIEFEDAPPAVRISDSGPGVPEDERLAVLGRMVRGRNATGEGSGLGLSIVHDIASLHGATLTLDQGVLGGACVTLRFDGDPAQPPAD